MGNHTGVRIHDHGDRNVPVLARMLEKRIRMYRAIGYEIEDAAMPSRPAEHVIGYDEDA